MTEPRWLDDDEMAAWRSFVHASVRLFERLDREIKADHGLTHDDYAILVNLSEAPALRMRMTELASRVLESKSRLSHHVGRLEAEGLVRRESCPNDLRGPVRRSDAGRPANAATGRSRPRPVRAKPLHRPSRPVPTSGRWPRRSAGVADHFEDASEGPDQLGDCGGLTGT